MLFRSQIYISVMAANMAFQEAPLLFLQAIFVVNISFFL